MLKRAIAASRYVIVVAVVCLALLATAIFVYSAVGTVRLLGQFSSGIAGAASTKTLILGVIELVDLLLIGVTLYVIAIGLYELFVDPQLPALPWLAIKDIDDLKARVLGVVIVVLGVLFLGQVIVWDGERDLLGFGVAVALVIAALTYFLAAKSGDKDDKSS
jgi:uncharacterized membrane protein YqhA